MPSRMGPCPEPGCPELVPGGGRCAAHARTAWAGSTRRQRLPPDWPRRRRRILERDGYRCYICGGEATEVDHVQRGDDHHDDALASICRTCHGSKSAREGNAAKAAARRRDG